MEFNKRYNRNEFVSFLQNEFLPEDFEQQTESKKIERKTTYIQSVTKLGTSKKLELVVYEIRHTSLHDARVGLSKEAFRFLADEWESRALVAFIPEGNDSNYRFSLIEIDLEETEEGKSKRIYSNPHRYSYLLGKGISYYTPNKYLNEAGRVTNPKDLRNRFSVEVLTKAFYQELSDWYAWAVKIVSFPNKLNDPTDDTQFNTENVIRLVTRLIFVWFLKQKHLIPEEFFDEEYISKNLLKDFQPNLQTGLFGDKSLESKYYKAILQNLFFAMLNSPITKENSLELSERHFRSGRGDYDNNKLMRYEAMFTNPQLFVNLANRTVPFLNGGLFDCLDDKDNDNYIDGFSDRKEVQKALKVPDFLFFGEEAGKNIDLSEWYGDKKKKKVSARGIIDILKRYNFTVEENTPFDQDVSLDPELLGKVFENLLASYNPETQITARKQTGSFYTPREIVQYMVDESLVAHLKRMVGDELEEEYRKLLRYTDEELTLTNEQKYSIMNAIYNCKVLDPACGSGAFPVGMLQQMVHILSQLDPSNNVWKQMVLDEAVSESRNAFLAETSEEREQRLQEINETFEDQFEHPDYTRKLYLIENCLYGVDIQSIAIQICKLRFFISLVVDQKTNNRPEDNFGIRPLPNLEAKFVAANTLIGLDKKDISLFDNKQIREKMQQMKEINHKIFYVKHKAKEKNKAKIQEIKKEISDLLMRNGAIGDKEAQLLLTWDRFDQNASSSFFDPEWMFGMKDGFDIVIGNPPYLNANDLKKNLGEFEYKRLKKNYSTAKGTVDFYVYFFEKAINILRTNGVLSYITPNKYLCANYGKELRNYFIRTTQILTLWDVSRNNVFDASIYPVVILLQKKAKAETYNINCIDKKNIHRIFSSSQLTIFPDNIWGFMLSAKCDITNKILENCDRLTKYCKINATSTASEADSFHSYIEENLSNGLKLINTGTIDPFISLWGKTNLIDKGCRYLYPTLPNDEKLLGHNRYNLYNSPKIIISKMALKLEGFWDIRGEYASINTNCLHSMNIAPQLLLSWIHSKVFQFVYECYFEGLKMAGGYLPFSAPYLTCMCIPKDIDTYPALIKLVDSIINKEKTVKDNMHHIDLLIYKMCKLSYDELIIVDPKTSITREEYETNNK